MSAGRLPEMLPTSRHRGPNCGPGCRTVRAIPLGGYRAIAIDVHDEAFHEGVAWARGRDQGFASGQQSGAAWTLLALTPRLRQESQIVRTGPFVIDLWARTVLVNGDAILLTATEFDILAHLAWNLGRVCSAMDIAVAMWPDNKGRRHRHEALSEIRPTHSLSVHIHRLRGRLGPAARMVATRTGRGFILLDEPAEERTS